MSFSQKNCNLFFVNVNIYFSPSPQLVDACGIWQKTSYKRQVATSFFSSMFALEWVHWNNHSSVSKIDMETLLDQKLVSSWFDVQSVPQTYVHPPEKRPGKLNVPLCNNIPVVDLGSHDRRDTIHRISKASEEFGFFQVQDQSPSTALHLFYLVIYINFKFRVPLWS